MPQKSKLETLAEIVTNYSASKHEAQLLPRGHKRYSWHTSFKYLNPASWASPSDIPYVAATALIDAYSQLPQRPDLAFNSLWSATNSSYNDLYLSSHLSHGTRLTDTKSIEHSLQKIAQQLNQHITIPHTGGNAASSITIIDLIKNYIRIAPDKNFNFVAQYVLRGIAVERHNAQQNTAAGKIREILIPSAYSTFKSNFNCIYDIINNSTGAKFSALCAISESSCRTDINFGIQTSASNQARQLVHATGKILRKEATSCTVKTNTTQGSFDSLEHWLSFLIRPLLYASRNTAAHGNAASRLNSIFANAESTKSASWTFLFCYLYFSLILLCQGKISASDLLPLYENSTIAL